MNFRQALVALALCVAAPAEGVGHDGAVGELRTAEQHLLAAADGKPPPEAIASMLRDDTRLYIRGGPFVGRDIALRNLKANPANQGSGSQWRPIKTGISSDGKHGFTLGYFDIAGGDPAIAHRRYLAYWVRGDDGWALAAFKQGLRRPNEKDLADLPVSVPSRGPATQPDPVAARQSLIDAEQAFSDRAQVVGVGKAFAEMGRADAINGGTLGAAAIGAVAGEGETAPTRIHWSADDVLVAPSGDLGITFGYIRAKGQPAEGQPAAVPFFTVWMRDGPDQPWRYVAE